jgi:hypothetical protein
MSENTIENSENPEIIQEKEPESIMPIVDSTISNIDQVLLQTVNLDENNKIHEPSCLICCHPKRIEAEESWEKERSEKLVKEFLDDDKISSAIILNHMENHLYGGVKEIQKKEYIGRINRLNSQNMTTLEKIQLTNSIIFERLTEINSLTPSSSESIAQIEKIKSAETARLMKSLQDNMKYQSNIMGEMKSNKELLYIPVNGFIQIFNEAITTKAKNDREKELISSILEDLEELARTSQ